VSNLTGGQEEDVLHLMHRRTGCTAVGKIIEVYRHQLAMRTGLKRYHLMKKANKKGYIFNNFVCGVCARTKMTRRSFSKKEKVTHTEFLSKVTCDISVYLNCPSKEGWKYMLVFTDEATKMVWSYGLHERTADAVLVCLKDMYDAELPAGSVIGTFHSDGGRELITERVRMYLRLKKTRKFTNTPTDTPELNSVSERKFRTLGEMALAMLTRSGLPKIWWGKAYKAAQYIIRRMPTTTARGYMTPIEAMPGGEPPSWEWMRVWGCKAYVLKPKADRRKDWDDKAQVGYFVGYSEDTMGWQVWLPESDTYVTSVHVLFDESPPDRGEEYFKELDEAAAVFTLPGTKSVQEYKYLENKYHIDDEDHLLYITKRVVERKGQIVAYRAPVTGDRMQIEEKTSIHVADVARMTLATEKGEHTSRVPMQGARGGEPTRAESNSSRAEEFLRGLATKNGADDHDVNQGSDSSCSQMGGRAGESAGSEKRVRSQGPDSSHSTESGPASESASSEKRVRTQRVLSNVATLGGEANLLGKGHYSILCGESAVLDHTG